MSGNVETVAAGNIYYGTSSWTDRTLLDSKAFYPPDARKPEDRLRYYAERFPLVEVDSSFYALPSERNAELWAERTPAGFVFNVKAFGLMTQPRGRTTKSLPQNVREMLPDGRGSRRRACTPRDLPPAAMDLVWEMFGSALAPLARRASWARSCSSFRAGSRPAGRTWPTCASSRSARRPSPRSSSAARGG